MSKMSSAEKKFLDLWKKHGLPNSTPIREYQDAKLLAPGGRPYRFDFGWPKAKIIIEIHGAGGHHTLQGVSNDCKKLRTALRHGYIVVPITTTCMASIQKGKDIVHEVVDIIEQFYS